MNDEARKIDDLGGTGNRAPELSRREWILSLGSAVILSGFSGFPGDAQTAERSAAAGLPPGLYTPSIDHVTHALNSDGPFFTIPPGTETEFVRPRIRPFIPQAFSAEAFGVIRRLVEIILGGDMDTAPAAVPGGPQTIFDEVAEWIDLVVASAPGVRAAARKLTVEQRALSVAYFASEDFVRELENYEPDQICKDGLLWLQLECERRSFGSFLATPAAAQVEIVASSFSNEPTTADHTGKELFNFLKAEAIRGFYTSRLGRKELNYQGNSFYGHSPGCPHGSGDKPASL